MDTRAVDNIARRGGQGNGKTMAADVPIAAIVDVPERARLDASLLP
jgi:hypothetical protein